MDMKRPKTEQELRAVVEKARRAKELLEDPLMQEIIISLRGDLLHKFESTSLSDEKERNSVWNQSQVLNGFLNKFTGMIKKGENAKISILDQGKEKIRNII